VNDHPDNIKYDEEDEADAEVLYQDDKWFQ